MRFPTVAVVLILVAGFSARAPGTAEAQTVGDIARRGACSTSGVEGISAQLIETQRCLGGGDFVPFAPHRNISLASSRVHPFLQRSARDALWRASDRTSITVTSAFRTLAEQYVLYHSGGCGLAASPGNSNHQSGRAVDVGNYGSARSALQGAGCAWLGSRDPVHFDCPGGDRRSDAVRAFQRLWNLNHPSDRIAEDGVYGPGTASRLGRSPARGFGSSGCGCTARCVDGSRIRGTDCGVGDCAAFGARCVDDSLGARCVSVFCDARGTDKACLPDGDTLLTCRNGAPVGQGKCSVFGASCVDDSLGARCVAPFCPARGRERVCLPDGDTLLTCNNGGIEGQGQCSAFGAECVDDALGARCVSVFCEPRGEHHACLPDGDTLLTCQDGGIASSGSCGAFGATCVADELGARCVSVFCEPTGASEGCVPDSEVRLRCMDGGITETEDCEESGRLCSEGRCVSPLCPTSGETAICDPSSGEEVRCVDGVEVMREACAGGETCVEDEAGAGCMPEGCTDCGESDAGVGMASDGGMMMPPGAPVTGGCGCHVAAPRTRGWPLMGVGLLGLVVVRRRRRVAAPRVAR